MSGIVWDLPEVTDLLLDRTMGREFARIKTPKGWRSSAQRILGRRLEGRCFSNALHVALCVPEDFWYCEGFAAGLPHAWLCPKISGGEILREDWALDFTWPWKSKAYLKPADKLTYCGVKFEAKDAESFILDRLKKYGDGNTSVSLLKYPQEVKHFVIKGSRNGY
jgi:hypothetical protein